MALPSDETLEVQVREILDTSNIDELSLKNVRRQLEEKHEVMRATYAE